jgi:hypothetical protein
MKRYNIDGDTGYYDTMKLPSGQTIKIEFQEDWSNDKYYYNIYLVTTHKRKQESSTVLQRTGKDGLKGVMWAREKVKEFEEFIKEIHKGIPIIIHCGWDCNIRRNLYERGLKDLGYKFNNQFGYKVLSKTVINDE